MSREWRRWLPGPKHGVARGVAVFGSPGFAKSEQFQQSCGDFQALQTWATEQGVELDGNPGSLNVLDGVIATLDVEELSALRLHHEAASYVATVIIKHVPSAKWRVWPNGHPVLRLESGRDLDLYAKVQDVVIQRLGTLSGIYANAR